MSLNKSTYLKYVFEVITADAGFEQLSATDKFVYSLQIGVHAGSASASSGNYVGSANTVTIANQNGIKITSDQPLTVKPHAVGDEMIAVNLADYFVGTTSGDKIYVAYLDEVART